MTHVPAPLALKADSKDLLIEELRAENAALLARNAVLEAENAALRAKLEQPKKTPKNSSVPPSRAEKASGAQKAPRPRRRGRKGVHRPLSENPTRVEEVRVQTCPHCATDVSGAEQVAAEVYDHVEIPPIVVEVTRVVLHRGTCPSCQKTFKAEPPQGREPGTLFGPFLQALVAYMRYVHAVSYERLAALLRDLFSVKISEGALTNMLRRQAPAFAEQQERIRQDVRKGKVIASDETTMRVGKRRWWQWVFHSGLSCCFVAAATRSKAVVLEFLDGVIPEVWISDRLGSQMGWAQKQQVCLAHLVRDAEYAKDCGDTVFAPRIIALLCRAMWHHRARERIIQRLGAGAPRAFRHRINAAMDELLKDEPAHTAGKKLHAILVTNRDRLFVFLDHPEVSPTNNGSERALRPGVTFRKVTNCYRSEWGAHLHAAARSAIETGRRRGINAIDAIRLTLERKPLPFPA